MVARFLRSSGSAWLLALAALLVPSAVGAQEQSQFLVDEAVEFDFTPLVLGELAQAPSGSQEPGTDNQPVTVTPGESVAQEEGSLAKAA